MDSHSAERTEETPSAAVQRELARVSERIAGLLGSAGETAESFVSDARAEAAEIRAAAERQAEATRAEAEEFSQTARGNAYSFAQERRRQAEVDAEGHIADARAEAEHIIAAAHERRAGLQTVIADLGERRETLLLQLESIADSLRISVSRHREGVESIDAVPGADDQCRPPSAPAWEAIPSESGSPPG